jgi:hypothetical protein
MVKYVFLITKITIAQAELIGTILSALLILLHVLLEQLGMEMFVLLQAVSAKMVLIGQEVCAELFHVSVHLNSFGKVLKTDVSLLEMLVLLEHIILEIHVCHIHLARMDKYGVLPWFNAFVLRILIGMEINALLATVECNLVEMLDVFVLMVLSLMEVNAPGYHQINAVPFNIVN